MHNTSKDVTPGVVLTTVELVLKVTGAATSRVKLCLQEERP
jgi:hypothetical protein